MARKIVGVSGQVLDNSRENLYRVDPEEIVVVQSENTRSEPVGHEAIVKMAREFADPAIGQMEPVVCRPIGDGKIQLVFGYTRHAAAMLLKNGSPKDGIEPNPHQKLKVDIRNISAKEAVMMSVLENRSRTDTSPIDDAKGIRMLRSAGHDDAVILEKMRISGEWMRLLDKLMILPDDIKGYIHRKQIPVRVGASLADMNENDRMSVLTQALRENERRERLGLDSGPSMFDPQPAPGNGQASPAGSEPTQEEIEQARERLASGEKVPAKPLAKALRNKQSEKGKSPKRPRGEIVEYFTTIADGDAEDPAVRAFAQKVVDFADGKCGDRAMNIAFQTLLEARPSKRK